jgi:serine/threonine-protein kinase
MKKQRAYLTILLLTFLVMACQPSVEETQSAMPSLTQTKTDEPTLTKEPPPTQTITSIPTKTLKPTNTLKPTSIVMGEIIIELSENEADGAEMVFLPAGEFPMGSEDSIAEDDEAPEHTVFVDAFWIYKHEVTNAQFAAFLNAEGNQEEGGVTWLDAESFEVRIHQSEGTWVPDEGYEAHPVVEVNWFGADAYCQWAGGRLPTEAEWEKAARGTDERTYPWGNSEITGERVNYCDINCSWINHRDNKQDDGYSETSPVGNYPEGASPYGALDMAGNVWEWVYDWYDANYYSQSGNTNNPQGPEDTGEKVLRGGAYDLSQYLVYGTSGLWNLRASDRLKRYPGITSNLNGFRCVLPATP